MTKKYKIIIEEGDFIKHDVPAGQLIYATGYYFFDYLFALPKDKIFELLRNLFSKKQGIFSYKFASVAIHNKETVGVLIGYDSQTERIHKLFTILHIIKKYGILKTIPIILRSNNVDKFIGKIEKNSFYIANLAVIEDVRHRHVGSALLEYILLKIKKDKKYNTCSLDVSIKNKDAINLYKDYGFKIANEIRNNKLEKKFGLIGQYRMIKRIL